MTHNPNPWTPGPWRLVDNRYVKSGNRPVIYIGNAGNDERLTDANARLIAAAPEMAEVLERLLKPEANHDKHERIAARMTAVKLLARIRGEG